MGITKDTGTYTKAKSISLVLSLTFLALSFPVEAKKVNFQLPASQALDDGASPKSETEEKAKALNINLAPVGLDENKSTPSADAASSGSDDSVLKTSVSETDFLPKKNSAAESQKAVSVIDGKLGKKIASKKVEVAPLALMETEEEAARKVETVLDAEKLQMGELWQSTIQRNPDIQFVIQKLQPSSDANHAMASTMKVLGAALFGAMNVAPFMLPGGMTGANMLPAMGIQGGGSILQGLWADKAEKGAKKHQISQEQATMLYTIVRGTADKLVANYREYKKFLSSFERANKDLGDLQSMAAEIASKSPASAFELEYTLRKQKRDIEDLVADVKLHKQQLMDLAGAEAVDKLDQRLCEERDNLKSVICLPATNPVISPVPEASGPIVNPLAPNLQTAGTQAASKPPL